MNNKHLKIYGIITAAILAIPLVAMQVTDDVDWGFFDFVFIGVLLFGSGVVYELVAAHLKSPRSRMIFGALVVAGVIFVWGMAAVGLDYIDQNYAPPLGQNR